MSIMVEYNLPEWCEGCNELSIKEQSVGDIYFSRHLSCAYLSFCKALRAHWKLDDEQSATNCDKTQWISIEDKLPDDNERIIVMDEYGAIYRARFKDGCWRELAGFGIPNVKLWMSEPELPDEY